VDAGALSVGNLLIVVAYVAQMYEPLKTMSQKLADLQSGLVSVERAFALLDQTPEVHETTASRRLVRAAGSVSFRNVAFTHDNGHRVLQDVSFDVEAGARVGISGQSGAGKTTLLNMLMRFYDPTEGAILLDGVDIRSYELSSLRSQFALVLQDSVLFSTTIIENIRYGRPNATDDDVLRAARDANAHEFITRLPDKYQTPVGERGMCLSGGERQRIALARAFLRNAPLLILDEPTSAVDRETEAAMLEALERLMRNRTTFIISHRVSALEGSDLLLEIGDRRAIPRRAWPDLAEAAVAG
jgi:ATP-binding cassette subfamily B protein